MRFLFPTVIHDKVISNFDQDLCIRLSREIKIEDTKGVEKSNVGGWQSDYIKFKKSNIVSLPLDEIPDIFKLPKEPSLFSFLISCCFNNSRYLLSITACSSLKSVPL